MVHQIYNKNRQDYTPVGQTWYRVRQEIKEMEERWGLKIEKEKVNHR